MRFIAPVILSLAYLAGCAGPTHSLAHHDTPWLNDMRLKEWQKLEGLKEAVNRDGEQPQMQEHEGCGTMFVWKHSLSGGPGWEFLRASYSYKNTTDQRFDIVRVWLEILDADGRLINRKEDILVHPFGYALTPGDTWSDVLKVRTNGAHEKKGWTWRIGCAPVQMKVLPAKRVGENE